MTPTSGVRLNLEYQRAWRANGQPFAGTQNVRDPHIADEARAQIVWMITPRLSFTGRYEHLMAGPSLTKAGYRDSDFTAGWLSFRF